MTKITKAIQAKFMAAQAEMTQRLVERDDEVRLVLVGLIARENLLLVGPPGTAKSMLSRLVGELLAVGPGGYFEWQLSRFTEVDELFGPYDLMALKNTGAYVRRTDGKLPQAQVAYLDEYWNASSAVANSLHLLMNERAFNDGTGLKPVPLKAVVASSNIFPSRETGHENCEAAFDRFLLRREVQRVRSKAGRARILRDETLRNPGPMKTKITSQELVVAQKEAASLPVAPETYDRLEQLVEAVENEAGQMVLERRLQKCVQAARGYAYLSGADEVLPEHLEILAHCLWTDPQAWRKVGEITMRIANPIAGNVMALLAEADEIKASVDFSSFQKILATGKAATEKLRDVYRNLRKMMPAAGSKVAANPRVEQALAHISQMAKDLNSAVIASTMSAGGIGDV